MFFVNSLKLFTVVFIIALYTNSWRAGNINGSILLGVPLPPHALLDKAVTTIVRRYRMEHTLFSIVFFVLAMRLSSMAYEVYLGIYSFMAWIVFYLYLNQRTNYQYLKKLLTLKKEKEWWLETNHILTCDTDAIRLKDTFSISKAWFILPLFISAVPLLEVLYIELKTGYHVIHSIPLYYGGIMIQILSFLCFLRFRREKAVIYSGNTEMNIAIEHVYQREWPKCWIMTSMLAGFFSMSCTWIWSASLRGDFYGASTIITSGMMILFMAATISFAKLNNNEIRAIF